MILSTFVLNKIAAYLVKNFALDKMMSYVFDDNILDKKVKKLEKKVKRLEKLSHPQREFVVCEECKQSIKEKQWI